MPDLRHVFLDFETYYGPKFSLTSISTSEFVRDEQFLVHMVQIAIDDGPIKWVAYEEVEEELRAIDWGNSLLICHNTAFDGFILSDRYGIAPAMYADTMLMSRAVFGANVSHGLDALGERLGFGGKVEGALIKTYGKRRLTPEELEELAPYALRDVELMRKCYYELAPQVPQDESLLIDLTLAMFCLPVLCVNRPAIQAVIEEENESRRAVLDELGLSATSLSSNPQFAEQLRKLGVEPPTKTSPTTKKETFAFSKKDPGFLALAKHENEGVRKLYHARLRIKSTIDLTRAERFLLATDNDKRLPVLLNYCGGHTTRWSAGNNMNMQNLPHEGGLRTAIEAPPGFSIVTVDSAQIEARVALWLARDEEKLEIFRNFDAGVGPDLYRVMASKLYDKEIEDVTKPERQMGKICVLGLQFGMGAMTLKGQLEVDKFNPMILPLEECLRIVSVYRTANQRIVQLWQDLEYLAGFMITGTRRQHGPLLFEKERMQLPSGLAIHYNEIQGNWNRYTGMFRNMTYMSRNGPVNLYGGILTENAVQALARCIVATQMLYIAERYRVVMMTHDEVSYLAPTSEAEEALTFGLSCMQMRPTWAQDLPLNATGLHAPYYAKK